MRSQRQVDALKVAQERAAAARRGQPLSAEHKQKLSIARRGKLLSAEHRQKLSEAHKGKPNNRLGWKASDDLRKLSEAHMGLPGYWTGRKVPEHVRLNLLVGAEKGRGWNKGQKTPQKTRAKLVARWASYSPAQRLDRVRRAKTAVCARPNLLEQAVQATLDQLFPEQWVYNAGVMIGHRVPDFVHASGCRVLEVFGDYWHRGEDPSKTIAEYREHGVACVVVWEGQFHADPSCLEYLLA